MVILLGSHERKSTDKPMLWRRVMVPLLRLSHYHPLHQRLLPNLTLVIRQSFSFQSLFSQHWCLKQVSLKMRSRRYGMRCVLPRETRWPRIKKGDYNGLFFTSIYTLYLGCHFYPSSTSTNYTTSNYAIHGIIVQASNSMAIFCGELIFSYHKVWSSYLENHFNGSMHCILLSSDKLENVVQRWLRIYE